MKRIEEYDCGVDEINERIIQIVRSEGEPAGSYIDDDGVEISELQELTQARVILALMQRGIDVDTAVDLVFDMDSTIRVVVGADGKLEITLEADNPGGAVVTMEE